MMNGEKRVCNSTLIVPRSPFQTVQTKKSPGCPGLFFFSGRALNGDRAIRSDARSQTGALRPV
jgi:hypothetical protein